MLVQTRRIWSQICAALPRGDEPALADIQVFLGKRERVIEAARRRHIAADKAATLERRHAEWAEAVAARPGQKSSALPTLLALAGRLLTQIRELCEERLKLETTRTQLDDQPRTARASRSVRETEFDAWHERWRVALAELAWPADEEPAVTGAVLATLREVAAEHRKTTSLSEQISGMNAGAERFTRSVRDLAQALPSRAVAEDPFEAVRELGRALNGERAAEQRRRIAHDALETARGNATVAGQALTAASATLRAILDLIGAETIEAAEQRLALAVERKRHEAQMRAAAAELHASGDGFSIEELRAEAGQIAPEEVPARIYAAAAARREASEAAQLIAGDAKALEQRMRRRRINKRRSPRCPAPWTRRWCTTPPLNCWAARWWSSKNPASRTCCITWA